LTGIKNNGDSVTIAKGILYSAIVFFVMVVVVTPMALISSTQTNHTIQITENKGFIGALKEDSEEVKEDIKDIKKKLDKVLNLIISKVSLNNEDVN
jgi:hypothetical protein